MTLDRRLASCHSALWAAYGDALGFMTELADAKGVHWRTGADKVFKTNGWRRRIGGQFGAVVPLPAGTYSDDTQLRLSVARAIGPGGKFDAEAFAKIELTVWPAYALGAGRASKQAASNLARRDVNWFSNFYSKGERSYWESGGNGAAMRIQPHVWAAKDLLDRDAIAVEILRDAICTHGHPRALAGAILHGWWLAHVLAKGEVPGPSDWYADVNRLSAIDEWVDRDDMLATFWKSAWQHHSDMSLRHAMQRVRDELSRDIDCWASPSAERGKYEDILRQVGGYDPSQVGSGTKTALIASALAWRHRDAGPEPAVIEAANALASDTDTIATMVGAILGACTLKPPSAPLQDVPYLLDSTERLCRISQGQSVARFPYPDPGTWTAPKALLDTLVEEQEGLGLRGLGKGMPIAEPIPADSKRENSWQWVALNYGQSILVKRRGMGVVIQRKNSVMKERELPFDVDVADSEVKSIPQIRQSSIVDVSAREMIRSGLNERLPSERKLRPLPLDTMTQEAIRSGFDERLIGSHILNFAVEPDGIEKAIAYTAIILKAKRARWQKDQGESEKG